MFNRIFIMLFLLGCCLQLPAQLRLDYNEKRLWASDLDLKFHFDTSCNFSDVQESLPASLQWKTVTDSLKAMSYADYCTWIRIPLDKIMAQGAADWVYINNPHINRLRLWVVSGEKVVFASPLTGDAMPFSSRVLPARQYLFSLHGYQHPNSFLVIAADKRYTKLELPVHFQSNNYFIRHFEIDLKGVMFFLGFAFFLFLFNAYLFISTREAVFGFYILYLLLVCLYVCIDIGWLFKIAYPHYPVVNDIIRPASFALSIVPMTLFFNGILSVREHAPQLYRLNQWLSAVYLVLFIMAVSSAALSGDGKLQSGWLTANRIITPLMLCILMAEAVYFIRRQFSVAYFLLGSYLSLIFFSFVYIAAQINLIPSNTFSNYALYWGLTADAVFMGLSLAWRFKITKDNLALLQQEKANIEELLTIEIAQWKEQQMTQLSNMLHDRIGGLIGILRLTVDRMPLNEAGRKEVVDVIHSIASEIREYSHSMSPAGLQAKGVKAHVDEMIDRIEKGSGMRIQFEWVGPERIEPGRIELIVYYFLQEILQNMLKHADCSQAILQVIQQEDSVYVYAEDNGRGCSGIDFHKGIGLQSIQKITTLTGGKFDVRAEPGEGFSISIELNK